jgi:beta-phosphoglucomutase
MDGVLADTSSMHFKSWKMLGEKLDFKFSKKLFNETFGQKSSAIIRKILNDPSINDQQIKKWGALKEQFYRDLIKENLEPLPGVISLIQELNDLGFKLAVGSSGPKENVDLLLKTLNIKDFFHVIATAEDVNQGKPHPEVFLKISNKLRIEPKKCLVFEDAPVGIVAAKRADMKCIALSTTHNRSELNDADMIFDNFENFKIKKIEELLKIEV